MVEPNAQEFLKRKGLTGVGTYGLLSTSPGKASMHKIMEDYANEKVRYHAEQSYKNWLRELKLESILKDKS